MKIIGKIIIFLTCITLLIAAFWFIKLEQQHNLEIKEIKKEHHKHINKPLAILILGVDSLIPGKLEGWSGRSDCIVLLYVNPHSKTISAISIPRDTYITMKKLSSHKINAANQVGGYKLTQRAVKKLLGIDVDQVLVFSIKSVIDLIDAIGPIKIYVPQKMSYHDKSADLHIEIQPGLQTMRGKELMNFLRYRSKVNGDIGRIQRQHIFFRAAIKQLLEPETIFKMPGILAKANKTFITDMSFKEMFELGILLRSLMLEDKNSINGEKWQFKSYIVPGDFGTQGYWLPNEQKIKTMVAEITKHDKH